jgi:hypothetical protein
MWKLVASSQCYGVCKATEPKTSVNIPAGPVLRPESEISYSILFH